MYKYIVTTTLALFISNPLWAASPPGFPPPATVTGGDMAKATYDTDTNNKVDADKVDDLSGQSWFTAFMADYLLSSTAASTYQVILAEGAFVDGDKTKLDTAYGWGDWSSSFSGIATSTGIGLTAGDSYSNFGGATDDTLNELFAAIDTALGGLAGGHDAVTLATGVDALTLTGQEIGVQADLEAIADQSWSPTGTYDFSGATIIYGLTLSDLPTTGGTWSAGSINPTFGTVTAGQFVSSASDGDHAGGWVNTVAITATPTTGYLSFYNGYYWLADGTDWNNWLLDKEHVDTRSEFEAVLFTIADATAYNAATWDGSTLPANQDTVRDQFEAEPSATRTLTNKTIDYSATGNNLTLPWTPSYPLLTPADADDLIVDYFHVATTINSVACIANGTTPSITVDVQECDQDGASNCASILSAAITCNGGYDAGTVTDSSAAADHTLKILYGVPSGTVDAVTVFVSGAQTW